MDLLHYQKPLATIKASFLYQNITPLSFSLSSKIKYVIQDQKQMYLENDEPSSEHWVQGGMSIALGLVV